MTVHGCAATASRFLLGVSIASLAATAVPAGAQVSAPQSSPAQPVAASSYDNGVQDIVVTARRVNESAQRVPVALTAVGTAALAQAGITSLGQIQKVAPSVEFQQGPSNVTGYIVGIRGQVATETALNQDPSVGIYLDGIYIPRTAGLRGALVDMNRVEILRGPQGTLYGRNTTGGAVSSYTQDPTDALEGYVRGRVGNYAERDVLAVVNLPVAAINGAIRVVGNLGSNHGYGRSAAGARLGSEDRTYGRIKIRSEPTDSLSIMLEADYSKLKTGGEVSKLGILPAALSPTGLPGGAAVIEIGAELGLSPFVPEQLQQILAAIDAKNNVGRYNSSDENPDLHDDGTASGFAATVNYEVSDAISLRSITGYRYSKADRIPPISGGTPFILLTAPQIQTDRYFSEELQVIGNIERLHWVVGGYYGREHGLEYAYDLFALPALNPTESINEGYVVNKNLSAYAQAGYELTDGLTLTGGIRYSSENRSLDVYNRSQNISGTGPITCTTAGTSYTGEMSAAKPAACLVHSKDIFNTVSWLGSLDYQVAPTMLLYAKASRGFVSGGQNIRGTQAIPSSVAPFKPERATQFEIGEKGDFFDRMLRLNVAGYFTQYDNIQRVVNLPPGTVQAVINAASAHIYGFETEATLRPTRRLTLTGSVGYVHAKYRKFDDPVLGDRSDEPFSFPKWTYSLAANYTVETEVGPITGNVNWHYKSAVNLYPSVLNDAQVTQKGYGTLDARLGLKVDQWNTEFSIFSHNMTDKYYLVSANGLDNFVGYNNLSYGQPRTFGAEATVTF